MSGRAGRWLLLLLLLLAWSAGADQLMFCAAGKFEDRSQHVCRACVPGKYSAPGASWCDVCPDGKFSLGEGSRECHGCAAGQFANVAITRGYTGSNPCSSCAAGKFLDQTKRDTCVFCPAGTFGLGASVSSACDGFCSAGFYSKVGALVCLHCTSGMFQDLSGQSSCKTCSAGRFSRRHDIDGEKSVPPSRRLSNLEALEAELSQISKKSSTISRTTHEAAERMIAAQRARYPQNQPDATSDQPVSGVVTDVSSAKQRAQRAHLVDDVNDDASAKQRFQIPQPRVEHSYIEIPAITVHILKACTSCAAGQYTGGLGQTSCQACAAGRFGGNRPHHTDSTTVTGALFGREHTGTEATTSAACWGRCAPGRFSTAGARTCSLCGPGHFQAEVGQSSCEQCTSGRFSVGGDELAKKALVEPGSSSTTAGKAVAEQLQLCTQCASGFFANASGFRSCTPCPAGRYGGTGLGAKTAECGGLCPVGTTSGEAAESCTTCTPGTFTVVPGTKTCSKCPPGTFGASTNTTGRRLGSGVACVACAGGMYSSASASARCEFCEAGRSGQAGSATSLCGGLCSGGKFSAQGEVTCRACPPGSYQPTMGQSSCLRCTPGQHSMSGGKAGCKPCGAGRYAVLKGTATCKVCPAGRHGSGGSASSACDGACAAGQFSEAGHSGDKDGCKRCAAGRFTANSGARTCTECPTGSYGNGGSATSTCDGSCPAGRFSTAGAVKCTACPPGRTSVGGMASVGQASSQKCTACAAGTYSAGGDAGDLASSAAAGATAASSTDDDDNDGTRRLAAADYGSGCMACPAGMYSIAGGWESCTVCPAGHFGLGGSTSSDCSGKCPAGKYSARGMFGGVAALAAGRGAVICEPCPGGKFQLQAGMGTCSFCPAGKLSKLPGDTESNPALSFENGAGRCSSCAPGRYAAAAGAHKCAPCAAGRYGAGGSISSDCDEACSAGRFSTAGAGVCTGCMPGQYQSFSGQVSCTHCSSGYWSGVGTTGSATEFQQTRNPEVVQPEERGELKPEVPVAQGAAQELEPTTPDDSAADSAANTAELIPEMPVEQSLSTVLAKYQHHESDVPPPGLLPVSPERQKRTGFRRLARDDSGPPNSVCSPCSPGRYRNADEEGGSFGCMACAAGHYSVAGQTECIECPASTRMASVIAANSGSGSRRLGTKADAAAADQCPTLPCPAGFSGGRFRAGQWRPSSDDTGGSSACSPCTPGRFASHAGTIECMLCPAGRRQNAAGAKRCDGCQAGRARGSLGGGAGAFGGYGIECELCVAGRFTDIAGAVECTKCAAGQFGHTGAATRSCSGTCKAGHFSEPGALRCATCQPGRFQGAEAQHSCSECGKGRFSHGGASSIEELSLSDAAIGCAACTSGRFSPATGMQYCQLCARGRYASKDASEACMFCPTGQTSPGPRAGQATGNTECTARELPRANSEHGLVPTDAPTAAPTRTATAEATAAQSTAAASHAKTSQLTVEELKTEASQQATDEAAQSLGLRPVVAARSTIAGVRVAAKVPPQRNDGGGGNGGGGGGDGLGGSELILGLVGAALAAIMVAVAVATCRNRRGASSGESYDMHSFAPPVNQGAGEHIDGHQPRYGYQGGGPARRFSGDVSAETEPTFQRKQSHSDQSQFDNAQKYQAKFDTWRMVGLRLSPGGEVVSVAHGSQAERAGVHMQDKVISVNGNNVSGSPPFWKKGEGTIRVEFAKSWQ